MTQCYTGVLEAYWEQGWEGRVDYALFIEGLGAPFFLATGQRLTIYAEDGGVLWTGMVRLVRRKWREQHHLSSGIWSYEKQAGLSYTQWMAWFLHDPPLRAIVEVDDGGHRGNRAGCARPDPNGHRECSQARQNAGSAP